MHLRGLYISLLFLLSCISLAIADTGDGEDSRYLENIVSSMERYSSAVHQQKVYLHLNNSSYKAGEIIWFKAYLVDALTHQPDRTSTNLYVELINSKKVVVGMKRIRMVNGSGYGDFMLRDTVSEGLYQIRSYTNWMRNFDPDFYFTRNFTVSNPDFKKYISGRQARINRHIIKRDLKKSKSFDIRFFPEGGSLVSGIESVVGFKAINRSGLGIDVSGEIYDSHRNKVVSFNSVHSGMGSFRLKPEPDSKYYALVRSGGGREIKVELPEALERSIVMAVDNSDEDRLYVDLYSNRLATKDRTANEFFLIGQARGKIYFSEVTDLSAEHARVVIEKSVFPTGVVQLTLMSYRYEPVAERLVFVNHNDYMIINAFPQFVSPSASDSVRLMIELHDADGNPLQANVSLSVLNAESSRQDMPSPNILSNLLLTSDLKGYIENPACYFRSGTEKEKEALDKLMLTQGWRRFTWQDVMSDEIPDFEHPVENDITIGGQITGELLKFPLKGCDIKLTVLDRYNDEYYDRTNEKGYFQFENLVYYDTVNIKIEARRPSKRKNLIIVLPEAETSDINNFYGDNMLTTVSERDNKAYRRQKNIEYKQALLEQEKEDWEKNRMTSIHGEPDYVIKSEDIPSGYSDALQVMKGRVPGVNITGNNVVIRGISTLYGSTEPLYIIDGVPAADVTSVLCIPVEDIDRIEVLKGPSTAIYGNRGANGVIAIYTKRGTFMKKGIIEFSMLGYYTPREFYQPKYEVLDESSEGITEYSAIYWKPVINTDKSGRAEVYFRVPAGIAKYSITIEGISDKGHPGNVSLMIDNSR
jgi:TonB-dependent SusC/RagA subfamily outer membrane receptor